MHARSSEFVAMENKYGVEKEKKKDERPTLFRAIYDSTLPQNEKNAQRLAHEGFLMIAAGSETTARIITKGIFHLLDNPETLKPLQAELHEIMPARNHIPSTETLKKMPRLVSSHFQILQTKKWKVDDLHH